VEFILFVKVLSTVTVDDDEFVLFPRKDQPELGDAVCLDFYTYYIGRDNDDREQNLRLRREIMDNNHNLHSAFTADRWIVTIGDGDIPPAYELAARYLKLHEEAWVTSHSKYAFGHSGRSSQIQDEISIPPLSTILIRISNRGVASSTSDLFHNPNFRIKRAQHKKKIGNDCYQHEWIEDGMGKHRALKLYGSACEAMTNLLRDLDTNDLDQDIDMKPVRQDAVQLLVDCFNNISAYHLRDKAYGKAKEAAANALRIDPDNHKALYRAARAAMLDPSGSFEESDLALSLLENLDPDNNETKILRHELQRRMKDYKKREKEMYGRMVQGFSNQKEENSSAFDETPIKESTRSTLNNPKDENDLSFRSIIYSWIIHIGVIGIFWWFFPVLRDKFRA
jgi:FK506-binding protein 8